MEKVQLYVNQQQGKQFYTMIIDPRKIVDLLQVKESGEVQENQRPWNAKKVKQIAKYVALKGEDGLSIGLIPNSPLLSIRNPLEVQKEQVTICREDGTRTVQDSYFIEIPNTADEVSAYLNTIDIIDGQHRVLAFRKDLRDPEFKDKTAFEMTFAVFTDLTKEEIKQLFVITNDKQDKVQPNLLRLFRKMLGLFNDEEEKNYDLANMLNNEKISPLYNRIMIGANVISKGYKEQQVSKILKNSGITALLDEEINGDTGKFIKILSNYIRAWEKEYKVSYSAPGKDTLTKISGLRYILFMFPSVWEILKYKRIPPTQDEFQSIISELPSATGVVNVFDDNNCKAMFKGESSTVALAKNQGKMLRDYLSGSNDYNPADMI